MITIGINGYKRKDITILIDALDIAFSSLECCDRGCDVCEKFRICRDIQRAADYLERIVENLELEDKNG